jgi:hypothetical protein
MKKNFTVSLGCLDAITALGKEMEFCGMVEWYVLEV